MRRLKRVWGFAAVSVLAFNLPTSRAIAEDTKGKWQFGFGLSYYSTQDYIRSNADLAVSQGVVGENGIPSVGSVDERPDINIMNQASIHDDFRLDFNASYGLTRWLALEAAASYMNAPVGNIEFYTRDVHQGISAQTNTLIQSCGPDPNNPQNCWDWTPQTPDDIKTNSFLPVGTITEIPVQLSGLVRFRPESPLDPYIGLGVGYIFTDLQPGDEFKSQQEAFSDPTFRVTVADEGEYTLNTRCRRENASGCTDFHPGALEANVRDTWEWHAIGGIDYYMSDKFSLYMDARYTWATGAIDIRTDDAHQVRFGVVDEGQILLRQVGKNGGPFNPSDSSTWLLWEDTGIGANQNFQDNVCPKDGNGQSMCRNSGYLETEDKNVSGALDTQCVNGEGYCEDEGFLYQLPPGTRDVNESLRIACPNCAHNGVLDTEDTNGNGYLDRFLLYGYDICTTDRARSNPRCTTPYPTNNDNITYIWPEGCSQTPKTLGPFAQATETGCPAFIPPVPALDQFGNPIIDPTTGQPLLVDRAVKNTAVDNAADTFIVQGGKIRMGGFALGIGFKFTF